MRMDGPNQSIEDTISTFERKVKQLKLEYEKYFLGTRPNEPAQQRSEVQKLATILAQEHIKNTAMRFRYNSVNSRYQAFKRQWDETCRQIDAGTYKRHVFKAKLKEREAGQAPAKAPARKAENPENKLDRLFGAYQEALAATGKNPKSVTREKLQAVIQKQEAALRQKLGCDEVSFRVVVQEGKVKLRAGAA